MRSRTARPRTRKGCRRADRRLRRPRQPPGPPGPQALARNAPPGRTMGNQARRPRARAGTRPSPGPRPDRGTRPVAPLRIRCRTALAASIGHRSGIAHRHVDQASARIVPSGYRQRQPEGEYPHSHASGERGRNQRLGQDDVRHGARSPARCSACRARRPVLGSQLGHRSVAGFGSASRPRWRPTGGSWTATTARRGTWSGRAPAPWSGSTFRLPSSCGGSSSAPCAVGCGEKCCGAGTGKACAWRSAATQSSYGP